MKTEEGKVEEEKEVQKEAEGTEKVETQKEATEKKEERTYTQAEYEEGRDKAIAAKMKGLPSKEEFAEFKAWKESQKQEEETKQENLEKQKEKEFNDKINNLKNENLVLKSGVTSKYADYVLFTVSKMDGEFADNLETFLKENEEFTKTKPINTGIKTEGSAETKESGVQAILRERNPGIFN